MPLSLKAINAELAKRGFQVTLAKGEGYFFFQGGDATDWLDRTVRRRHLTHLAFLRLYTLLQYIVVQNLELKKGSAELMILSLVEDQARHGYDISRLIEQRSGGTVKFRVASLYPLLYRLEERGWIHGRWVEKAGQRRRRYYHLTKEGRHVLAAQRRGWLEFVQAINCIAGLENA